MEKPASNQTLKKVVAELVLIVAGVSIALLLENELEVIKEEEIEQAYVLSFQQDWKRDIDLLKQTIKRNQELKSSAENLFNDLRAKKVREEELPERIFVLLSYQFFTPQDFTFQSVQETGDFRLLRDDEFKRDIIQLRGYYEMIEEAQKNFQQALDYHIVPLFMDNVDIANQKVVAPDFINDHRLLNLVSYTTDDLSGRINLSQMTLDFLEKILEKVGEN